MPILASITKFLHSKTTMTFWLFDGAETRDAYRFFEHSKNKLYSYKLLLNYKQNVRTITAILG